MSPRLHRLDLRYSGSAPEAPVPKLLPSDDPLVEYALFNPLFLTFLNRAPVLLVLCTQHLANTEVADPQEALMTLVAA